MFSFILGVLAVILLLAIIFVPSQTFAYYANRLFGIFLIAIPPLLLAEVYYFVKDTPQRKAAEKSEKTYRQKIKNKIEWGFIIILVLVLVLSKGGYILKKLCPESIQGNPNAEVKALYFFDPMCPRCWKQEVIVQDILTDFGAEIRVERYDSRYCKDIRRRHGVTSVPGFLINIGDQMKSYGTLTKQQLTNAISDSILVQKNITSEGALNELS